MKGEYHRLYVNSSFLCLANVEKSKRKVLKGRLLGKKNAIKVLEGKFLLCLDVVFMERKVSRNPELVSLSCSVADALMYLTGS